MNLSKKTLVLALLVSWTSVSAAAPYQISTDSIYHCISVLASDSLEGRETGEPGEWKAAQYLAGLFKQSGLEPRGDSGTYYQSFDFIKGISFGSKNRLTVNGMQLRLNEDYVPLFQSASVTFSFKDVIPVDYGVITDDSSYNDYSGKDVIGKAVIIKRYAPSSESNPHVDFDKYSSITDKIITAINRKAAGIIFITPEDKDDTLPSTGFANITAKDIPILWLKRKGTERLGLNLDRPEIKNAVGEVELVKVHGTGHNVIGYLRSKSDTTIVVGGHYDHLGYGGPTSRYRGKDRKIHCGADDNASGASGVIELARYFSSIRNDLKHSLLFIAFSGEEEGILGSSYFVRHMTVDSGKIRLMANMDMIGRLHDQESGLAIFGTGTAAEFKAYFDSLKVDSLKLTFREPGTGPSDHTAFYNSQIPVLHLFTGAHEDYHTPDDVIGKIDLNGIAKVVTMLAGVITHFDSLDHPLTFQKTKDPDEGKRRASYSVTLGVMPDYVAQVKGLKVDGVSPDRPAGRAGIKKGDIIIKLGAYPIDDIYAYMASLGKFRKGDSTVALVCRNADTLRLNVVFK